MQPVSICHRVGVTGSVTVGSSSPEHCGIKASKLLDERPEVAYNRYNSNGTIVIGRVPMQRSNKRLGEL